MQIFVRMGPDFKRTVTLEVVASDTIADVKRKIQDKEGLAPKAQLLVFNRKQLDDDSPLRDYGVFNEAVLHVVIRVKSLALSQIFIRISLDSNLERTVILGVEASDTIEDIKRKVEEKEGLAPETQCLIFDGKQLEDNTRTLRDYEVDNESILHLVIHHRAAEQGHTEAPQVLLTNGADDVLAEDNEAHIPLRHAAPDAATTTHQILGQHAPAPHPDRVYDLYNFDLNEKDKLDSGPDGDVYKVWDKVAGRYVVMKLGNSGGNLKEEADVLLRLKHKNVVEALYFNDGTTLPPPIRPMLFLEWVPCGSVANVCHRGPVPDVVLQRFLFDALTELAYLHEQEKVLHRNIKPGNMLVDTDGTLKLACFGHRKASTEFDPSTDTTGMLPFMSREAAAEGYFSQGSDLWALGGSALQMASGRPPWSETGKEKVTLFSHICTTQPPNHHPAFPEDLNPQFAALLQKMFSPDPKQRGSAAEHLQDPYLAGCAAPKEATNAAGGGPGSSDEMTRLRRRSKITAQQNSQPRTCCICLDAPAEYLPVPCGHMCLCGGACKKHVEMTEKCPVCKTEVARVTRLYVSPPPALRLGESRDDVGTAIVRDLTPAVPPRDGRDAKDSLSSSPVSASPGSGHALDRLLEDSSSDVPSRLRLAARFRRQQRRSSSSDDDSDDDCFM